MNCQALFSANYTGDDENANLWTYDKVLDHCKGLNGKVEYRVLWDDGSETWESLFIDGYRHTP